MPFDVDTSAWSGEGAFTQLLIDRLRGIDGVGLVRVEDAPATRSDADYNFISNEIYVGFATADRHERVKRFGLLPSTRIVTEKVMTLPDLEAALAGIEGVGPPDYGDEGMLQYLRAERIVPPYQTKGYKLVEVSTDSWGHADGRLDLHGRVGWRDATQVAFNGLGMLIHQAALAFEGWTGVEAPLEAMAAAVR